MYIELLNTIRDRPLVNYIYAQYYASNAAQVMEERYQKNKQGEFKAKDLLEFLDYYNVYQNQLTDVGVAENTIGAVKDNRRVDFTDAEEALNKADKFNDKNKALVATVYQHGNVFNIHVKERNSKTVMHPVEIKEMLRAWDAYRMYFKEKGGVDIENVPEELKNTFNAYNIKLADDLWNIQYTPLKYIYKKAALTLFTLNPNGPWVQRAVKAFGSVENAAQAVDDVNHGIGDYVKEQKNILAKAVVESQKFDNYDLNALQEQILNTTKDIESKSEEQKVKEILHKLNKEYNIEINQLNLTSQRIDSLSKATAEAILQINRKLKKIERQKGNVEEAKKLEKLLKQLTKELANKRYYSGLLSFLNEATVAQKEMQKMYKEVFETGDVIQDAFDRAKTLETIKTLTEQYYPIIEALASDNISIDESIDKKDVENLQKTAKELKDLYNVLTEASNISATSTMVDILQKVIGDTAPDGQIIANLVKMAQKDTSIMDFVYSMGRSSNTVIAAMGSIIRQAQMQRDPIMNDISRRIRREDDKLLKSDSTSEFIYVDEEHLLSDIDWNKYIKEASKTKKALAKTGLKGAELREAFQEWEESNTEERVVDKKTGRTERVPDKRYRNNLATWDEKNNKMILNSAIYTKAQQDYYDAMMQIKGELGSMLPFYAQRQYFAPQIRRNTLEALEKAKNLSDYLKIFKNKIQDIYKVREDDTRYGIINIEGQDHDIADSYFDNTPLREIPIFYMNRVEEGELLKNFSTGLQHFAGTAINYAAINEIKDVIEFMGNFTKNLPAKDPKTRADVVNSEYIVIAKDLVDYGKNTHTSDLIDGFISQYIYGETRDPREKDTWWRKLGDTIIQYTSFKGLATNVFGAVSNYLVGEAQMLIEAGAGEFYKVPDCIWAHTKLFGKAGVGGEITDLLTNNMRSKATLMRELFDPMSENFENKKNQRYNNGLFTQILGHDCSFIGYASGEYLIHYVNMYSVLHREKALLNGKVVPLYDVFKVGEKKDGNAELEIKEGATTLDGKIIDKEYLGDIRKKIKYVNDTTHGAMNTEDKGIIHRKLVGRAAMNFRQWMVEHYSRRFRTRHYDYVLGTEREGYWNSFYHLITDDQDLKWKNTNLKNKIKTAAKFTELTGEAVLYNILPQFISDLFTFSTRAKAQWSNLDDMQKSNVKRAMAETRMFIALLCLSAALGDPKEHKDEWWRRFCMYQVKRLITDTEASMPIPSALKSGLTILQSPIAGVNTLNGLLYGITGLFNGDLIGEDSTIKSGPHKGENRYWRNVKKYDLPFFKDWDRMKNLGNDESLFQVFKDTPSNY